MLFARSLCHRMLDITVVNADTAWDLIHFLVLQELQGVHPANGGAAVPGESLQPSRNDLLCRSACVLQDADYWVGEFLITPYACAGSAAVAPAKYSKNPLTQSDWLPSFRVFFFSFFSYFFFITWPQMAIPECAARNKAPDGHEHTVFRENIRTRIMSQ